MKEIKTGYFQKDFEKLIEEYDINAVCLELDKDEQMLFCVGANVDGVKVRLNEKTIDEDNFKKVIELLYDQYCIKIQENV